MLFPVKIHSKRNSSLDSPDVRVRTIHSRPAKRYTSRKSYVIDRSAQGRVQIEPSRRLPSHMFGFTKKDFSELFRYWFTCEARFSCGLEGQNEVPIGYCNKQFRIGGL